MIACVAFPPEGGASDAFGDSVPDHVSPFRAETVHESACTLLALQWMRVVLPDFTKDGMARMERSAEGLDDGGGGRLLCAGKAMARREYWVPSANNRTGIATIAAQFPCVYSADKMTGITHAGRRNAHPFYRGLAT